MSNQFDDLSRDLSGRRTRRSVLGILGATVAGAIASTLRPDKADAAPPFDVACIRACRAKGLTGPSLVACLHDCLCEVRGGEICVGTNVCCPKGTRCQVTNTTIPPIGVNGTIGINGTIGVNGTGRVICVPLKL